MTAALTLYRMGLGAIEPLAPMLLRRRARRGKEDPARLGERLGHASEARPDGPLIWLHGASVGETLSLLPLVDGLRRARPKLALLVTSGTVTSAALLARRLPEGVIHQYVPVDAPGAAQRFLGHWRPDVAVLVESELWPNLLLGAQARGARLALLSARLSADSLGGWARAPGAVRRLLSGFDLVMAQDDDAARRLERLGAPDDGRLNLKLAGDPLPVDAGALEQAQAAAGGRPVLLAASTHLGEDAAVLDAFLRLGDPAQRRLVIAPRHPARGLAVAELAQSLGLTTARRGAGEAFGATPVYVADTLGELGLWLRLCRAALIGGGLVPGVGGHNPLEPARLDRPFASGPHVSNWRGVYEALHQAGAATVVHDAAELADFWRAAEADAPELARQTARAAGFARTQAGAVDDAVARLLELLP